MPESSISRRRSPATARRISSARSSARTSTRDLPLTAAVKQTPLTSDVSGAATGVGPQGGPAGRRGAGEPPGGVGPQGGPAGRRGAGEPPGGRAAASGGRAAASGGRACRDRVRDSRAMIRETAGRPGPGRRRVWGLLYRRARLRGLIPHGRARPRGTQSPRTERPPSGPASGGPQGGRGHVNPPIIDWQATTHDPGRSRRAHDPDPNATAAAQAADTTPTPSATAARISARSSVASSASTSAASCRYRASYTVSR